MWTDKTEVFEYDDVIHHLILELLFHCLKFSMDGRKRFEYATCERVFFGQRSKNISVFKNIQIRPLLRSFHFDLFQVDFSNLLQRKEFVGLGHQHAANQKREGIWAKLTCAKTSGTVTKDRGNCTMASFYYYDQNTFRFFFHI